jgi:hypothetical protein
MLFPLLPLVQRRGELVGIPRKLISYIGMQLMHSTVEQTTEPLTFTNMAHKTLECDKLYYAALRKTSLVLGRPPRELRTAEKLDQHRATALLGSVELDLFSIHHSSPKNNKSCMPFAATSPRPRNHSPMQLLHRCRNKSQKIYLKLNLNCSYFILNSLGST